MRPAAWSFFSRASSTTTFCSSLSASLRAAASSVFGLVVVFEPVQIVGQLEVVIEIVGIKLDGLGERRDRLFQIAKAGQDLGQSCQVFGVLVGAVGDLVPRRPWLHRAA